MRHYGWQQIFIAETNDLRRRTLEQLGGFTPYNPISDNRPDASADLVLDAVGSGRTRAESSRLVRPGGQIVHIGLQDNAPGLDTRRLTLQEITLKGTYYYRRADFAEALALLADGHVSSQGWCERRALDDGPAAFIDIDKGRAAQKIILQTR